MEFLIKQRQEELAHVDSDIKYYESEIKKRDHASSEAQGRIVESYINLLAGAKANKDAKLIEIENLKQALINFDAKFQQKDFEKKYQTKPTTIEINASLPQTKIAPNRKQNITLATILAIFLAVLYAFITEFTTQHKSEFKNITKNTEKPRNQPVPPIDTHF